MAEELTQFVDCVSSVHKGLGLMAARVYNPSTQEGKSGILSQNKQKK